MECITIGLLLPVSTIFPLSKDFEKGLQESLKEVKKDLPEIEFVKEFIGQGGNKQVENSLNKLFNYDEADIITGILSGKVTANVADKLLANKKPLITNDLGGYVPDVAKLNPYIYSNSFHLWQHAWALGYWGVKTFGKKGMYISSVYDAGYSFSHMFYEGMMAADPESNWSFSVPPMPENGGLSDMSPIFPFLEQYQPDFVFATFCGAETTLFLNEFIKRGWHKRTQVLGLPFLLTPFQPLQNNVTIYTTLPDINTPELPARQSFYQLGRQSAKLIAEALLGGRDLQSELLENASVFSHSGTNFLFHNTGIDKVAVVRNDIKAGDTAFFTEPMATANACSLRSENLPGFVNNLNLGWMNPYLCI